MQLVDTSDSLELEVAALKAKELESKKEVTLENELDQDLTNDRTSDMERKQERDRKELFLSGLEAVGCPRDLVTAYKEKYKTVLIYPYDDDKLFLIRFLKVKDIANIKFLVEAGKGQEETLILKTGILFPSLTDDGIQELPAGLPSLLVNVIMKLSGYLPVEVALQSMQEL